MYKVYVLKSDEGKTYIGHSQDSSKRVSRHNRHSSKATRFETGWIVAYEETFDTRSLAIKREKFFKSGDGRRILISKGIIG